jgi:bacterioferritin (cytochrome b1)
MIRMVLSTMDLEMALTAELLALVRYSVHKFLFTFWK